MEASVISFYDAFPQYEAGYQNFLLTHTFSANPSYTRDLDQIFAGANPTALMSDHPGLVTALYDMMSEFPWYDQFFHLNAVTTVSTAVTVPTTATATATATATETDTATVSLKITPKTTTSASAASTSAQESSTSTTTSNGSRIRTSAIILGSVVGLCYIAFVV